jgi:hypothetical protein
VASQPCALPVNKVWKFCGCILKAASPGHFSNLIHGATQVCTKHETLQRQQTIRLRTFSAESTDAAATAVFLYIYIDKEKQYSSRSKKQRNQHKDCPRWNSA